MTRDTKALEDIAKELRNQNKLLNTMNNNFVDYIRFVKHKENVEEGQDGTV